MRPAPLDQRDRLASRVFLVLHDPFTGRPLVGTGAVRSGVVGAQLAELLIAGRIGLDGSKIVLAHAKRQEDDEISGFVVDALASQDRDHDVPTWIATLADTVVGFVAGRLVASGVLQRGGRGLFGVGAARFPALDLLASARPHVRLAHMLRHPREMDRPGAVCAALLGAIGAQKVLDVDRDRAVVRAAVAGATDSLPDDLRGLLVGVEVACEVQSLPPSLRLRPSEG